MKKIIEIIELLIVVLVITFILNTYLFSFLKVYGPSMEPTFHHEDLLLIRKWGDYKANHIISFYKVDEQIFLVKRIIAIPGDNIESDGDNIFVNGVKSVPYQGEAFAFTLMDDEYFIVGDNHEVSIDSRNFGPIKKEFIQGIVIGRVWPVFP